MTHHPSRYFADDKDVFDLLMSQPKRLNNEVLLRFLRRRGFLVSPLIDRTVLVPYVSRLPLGFADLQELLACLGTSAHRTPRVTSESVAASIEAFEMAAKSVGDDRSVRRGESFRVSARDGGGLDIRIDYSVIDTKRSRLSQRSDVHVHVSVEPGTSSVRVRYPEDEHAREIADAIILKALGDPKEHVRATISLAGCNAAQRTQFFEELLKGTSGFSLRTVTRAAFRRPNEATTDTDLDGDADESNLPGVEDDDSGARILRIQLDGAGIFGSKEFQELKTSGFYVSGAVWRARQDGGEGLDAEFDAGFVVTDVGEAFSYKLRGVFRRDEAGEHSKTRESPSEAERTMFLRALEDAATVAATALVNGDAGLGSVEELENADPEATGNPRSDVPEATGE